MPSIFWSYFFKTTVFYWQLSTIFRRRQWQPTPVLLPGKSHGWTSLVGCSPWGHKELDKTERLHFHFSELEKEMATHSSVLAWRIPGAAEPGGLPSMGSQRIGHDWSNLAAAAGKYLHHLSGVLKTSSSHSGYSVIFSSFFLSYMIYYNRIYWDIQSTHLLIIYLQGILSYVMGNSKMYKTGLLKNIIYCQR